MSQGDAEALSKIHAQQHKGGSTSHRLVCAAARTLMPKRGHDRKCISPCPHGSPARQYMPQRAPGRSHMVQLQRMVSFPCPKDLLHSVPNAGPSVRVTSNKRRTAPSELKTRARPNRVRPREIGRGRGARKGEESELHKEKGGPSSPRMYSKLPHLHPSDCARSWSACLGCPHVGLSHGTLQGARRSRGAARKDPRLASSGTGMRACRTHQRLSCSVQEAGTNACVCWPVPASSDAGMHANQEKHLCL